MTKPLLTCLLVVVLSVGLASCSTGSWTKSRANNSSPVIRSRARRMAGGRDASIHEAPYVVQVLTRSGRAACTGVLVDAALVLTARHCLRFSGSVVYGTDQRWPTDDPNAKQVRVIATYAHPYLDVAMLQLSRPVLPDPVARAVSLTRREYRNCPFGLPVASFGFGWNGPVGSVPPSTLQTIHTSVVYCSRERISTRMWGRGACKGDSGSPLIDSEGRLVAVLSGGETECVPVGTDYWINLSLRSGSTGDPWFSWYRNWEYSDNH